MLTLLIVSTGPAAQAQESFLDVFEHTFTHLTFDNPVALRPVPPPSDVLLVAELQGKLWAFSPSGIFPEKHLVTDLSDVVDPNGGLLGIAAHPNFAENNLLYLFYVPIIDGNRLTRISAFSASGYPLTIDRSTEQVLIEFPRAGTAHSGGDIHFGPDGYLYISTGDDVCCADPLNVAQDLGSLLGKLLRIDVDSPAGGLAYGIPPDNPFVEGYPEAHPEIFAYGFRNPWRFSIDPVTERIWLGDVDKLAWEEVNLVVAGGNYGWSIAEGPGCLEWPPGSGNNQDCDLSGLIEPLVALNRDISNSVTGGYVYRGSRRPDLVGKYVFADWALNNTWTIDYVEGEPVELVDLSIGGWPFISSFGVDQQGELYALAYFDGSIFALSERETTTEPGVSARRASLRLEGANPFRSRTTLTVSVAVPGGRMDIDVYDAQGRRVRRLLADAHATDQSVHIDAAGLAGGTYYAVLRLDGAIVDAVTLTHVR